MYIYVLQSVMLPYSHHVMWCLALNLMARCTSISSRRPKSGRKLDPKSETTYRGHGFPLDDAHINPQRGIAVGRERQLGHGSHYNNPITEKDKIE